MTAPGRRVDPYANCNFLVQIEGINRAGFREVSTVESTNDVVEYREGGDNRSPRKLPSLTKYSNIVLRRGLTDDDDLHRWYQDAVDGNIRRQNGSIVVRDSRGQEVVRYNFFDAWPVKWTGPTFDATANDVAIETLELATERIVRV
jgi:phage tail-like protein